MNATSEVGTYTYIPNTKSKVNKLQRITNGNGKKHRCFFCIYIYLFFFFWAIAI